MMVFICVICSVKTPPLFSLSDVHRQLLHAIVAPFINMMEFRAYMLQICVDCKLLMEGVQNFQQTALRGIQAFKSLLNELDRHPPIVQGALFNPILEAKPEPITIKIDPENDFATIKQQFISAPASSDKKHQSIEIDVKLEPESTTEPDYDSESTRSADGIPDLISHPHPDLFMTKSGSSISVRPISAGMQSKIKNVVPSLQAKPGVSNIVCRVYTKKPEPKSTQLEKTVITENPVKPLQAAKIAQLAKNGLKVRIANPKLVDLQERITSKWQIAENAAKVASNGASFEVFTHETRKIPELLPQNCEEYVRVPKRKKPQKKMDVMCPHCNKTVKGKEYLKSHIRRFHVGLKPSPCETCGKLYRNETALKWHIKWIHEERKTKTIDDMNPELYCVECSMQFLSRAHLKVHLMSLKHMPREQYAFECETCKKKFPTDRRRQLHIDIVHLNNRPYKCEKCDKAFSRVGPLNTHVRKVHDKQAKGKSHVCHLCGKSFTISKSLQEHLHAHEGLRPFECKLCPATFTYKAALYTHNRLKHLKIKMQYKKKKTEKEAVGEKEEGRSKRKRRKAEKDAAVDQETEKEAGEFGKVDKQSSGGEKESEEIQKELQIVGQDADSLDISSFFNNTM